MTTSDVDDEHPYDHVVVAVAEAFWLEPDNAVEAIAALERLGYRVTKIAD